MQRADAAVAISGFVEQRLLELAPNAGRIVRIPNGVCCESFAASVTPRPFAIDPRLTRRAFFLFLGRLVPRKGADLLLSAFAHMSHGVAARLVVAGDGPELDALKLQAKDLEIGSRTHFVGHVENDAKGWLLQNALATVIPSRISEGCPLVVLESYAAGRPVIGTTIPGLNELITPDETGKLVAPDSPSELSKALVDLDRNPRLADELGEGARRQAWQHDWSVVANRYGTLFEQLMGKQAAA
jgi:glycosyltransferase involved in cell wall biosynthesis